jgi:ribose transport system permease protein
MTAVVALRRRLALPIPALLTLFSVVLYVVTALVTGQDAALSYEGITGLLQRMVALGVVALGQTFVILVGSIDLSVANLVSVSAVVASFVMQGDPGMIAPAIVAALAVSLVVGLVNGWLVAYAGINSLIATLGTGLILQGLLSASFDYLGGSVPEAYQVVAYGRVFGMPLPVVGLAVLAVGGWFLLARTRFGAHVYGVGGNRDGARLAGIRTGRVMLGAHVLASLAAGVTGLYLAARLRSGTPWIGRDGVYDLESIAVVVIGGTLLAGGRGGVAGTLAGVLLFATLDAVFNMIGVDAFLKQVLRGLIVIAAVAAYAARNRGHVA